MTIWRALMGLLRRRRRGDLVAPVRFQARRVRVVKWDGEPPPPGDPRLPVEVIEIDCQANTRRVLRPVNGVLEEVQDGTSEVDVRDQ